MYPATRFGSGSGPIFLDQLQCSGSEQSLLDCPTFTDVGLHSCDHSMDAGVKCQGLYMSMHSCSKGPLKYIQQDKGYFPQYIPHDLFFITDVNECETGEALCDPNADCKDILTSYSCQCRQGFEGNGFNCTGMKL